MRGLAAAAERSLSVFSHPLPARPRLTSLLLPRTQVVPPERVEAELANASGNGLWMRACLRPYLRCVFGVGNTLRKLGRYREALEQYEQLARLSPKPLTQGPFQNWQAASAACQLALLTSHVTRCLATMAPPPLAIAHAATASAHCHPLPPTPRCPAAAGLRTCLSCGCACTAPRGCSSGCSARRWRSSAWSFTAASCSGCTT